jgi:GMP synthase-like glutamine amidotransferase
VRPVIGICYGHQIIARAFDGEVKLNEKGFEIGVYDVELTPEGQEYLGYAEREQHMVRMRSYDGLVLQLMMLLAQHIHQVHRDIVPELPPAFNGTDFLNIGSTARCEVQGLALPYPTDAPPLPSTAGGSAYIAFDVTGEATDSSGPAPARSLQVLTVQGHPEFDEEIVTTLIDARSEMGAISGPDRDEGLRRAPLPHDGKRIGAVILSMLGVEPKRTDEGTQADGGVGV